MSVHAIASDRFNIAQAQTLAAIEALPIPEIARLLIPTHEAAPGVPCDGLMTK